MTESVQYLRQVIDSLRGVDRLITWEKDPRKLIREACRILSGMGGYVYSWILLTDGSGKVIDSADSGIGDDFHNLLDMVSSGQLPPCVSMALDTEEVVLNRADEPYCRSCRLKEEDYEQLESCVTRLEHDGTVFGVIAAGFPSEHKADDTQQALFREMAEDIAYALHVIRLEGERDRSIRSLRESEALLNAFLDHFPGPAFVRDSSSRYLHVNSYFRDLFGPAEKWVGKNPSSLFPEDYASGMMEEDGRTLEKGYHVYEKRLDLGNTGSVFEVHSFRIDREGLEPLIGGIAVDITEWYRAKLALRNSEEQLSQSVRNMETLLRTMPDIMFVLTRDGEYVEYWVEDESDLAIPSRSIVGSSIGELGLSDDKLDEILATIGKTLDTGAIQSVEYELDMDSRHRYFEARLAPYGGERVIAVVRDITARREAEMKRLELEGRIQHTQKLESLGVLAGGIAHDFNNLLMAIMGNADLAMLSLAEAGTAKNFLEEIVRAASTASDLARQMLAYSGRSDFEIHPLDLNEIVLELTHMLEVSISKKAVLKFRLAEELPRISADATQIRQILMNLITNASEAIEDRSGYISITTGAMYCDREYLATTELTDDIREDMYVYLEVADTGCGMDGSVKAQIFEPFFTTKYTGRGLGLSSVLGIVKGHGGAVKVYSEPGEGTTFKVLFPACPVNENSVSMPGTAAEAERWKCSGTVLFADDEDTVLAVGRKMLQHLGFDVLAAQDGRQALDLFREHSNSIVLAVLDLTMPHLSGDEVYREMRRVRKDVPVIVSSGFSRKDVMHRFAGKQLQGFIQKPYRVEEFSRLIRSVMDPEWTEGSE
ncbi:MAG: ATP-binding protein [Candidatus Aegiribacteria sp.]